MMIVTIQMNSYIQMQMKFVLIASTTTATEELMRHRQFDAFRGYTDDDGDGFVVGSCYTIVTTFILDESEALTSIMTTT